MVFCLMSTGFPLLADSAYTIETDVIFGRAADVDLKLDLARPNMGKGPFPALVYIFGGGWGYYSGNRGQCDPCIQTAASKGYVAVTVDYRLTNVKENGKTKYLFPNQLYDVKAAVRWLRANAEKYNIDPNRIGVVGWSSGGHLALMLGLTNSSDKLEGQSGNGDYSSSVQVVVCMAGLVEAVSFYRNTNVPERVVALLGGTPEVVPDQYRIASPLTFVSRDDPPVLFLQGDRDTSCPPEQAGFLIDKMHAVGASCALVVKKGLGHVSFYNDETVWSFLADHLLK
jgi:acetyl esterase/lipase